MARRRLLDLAACAQLRVHLNGEKLPIQGFDDYVRALGAVHVLDNYAKPSEIRAWRVAVLPRPEVEGDMDVPGHVSFVNNIWTPSGGTHVRHVLHQVAALLAGLLKKKRKVDVRSPYELNRYLLVVVCAIVINPKFNGQAKEELDTAPRAFGAAWAPSSRFKKALEGCDELLGFLQAKMEKKQTQALNRAAGGKKRTVLVDKLQDARHAGTVKSHECSLVLTEGDSAKTLAVAGIPDSKTYGVFALKGVCLNVRDISQAKAGKNKELQNLVKILGLEWGKAYATAADRRALRYGRVIVMADQDYDGFHITALIFNIFDVLWPELLRADGFLVRMQTPLLRVPRHDMEFFSMPAYTAWAEAHPDLARAATKYYKGLGTSTAADGKRYFRDPATYVVRMTEAQEATEKIRLLFSQAADAPTRRKAWLRGISTDVLEEAAQVEVRGAQTHTDFVDQQAAQFSLYTLERAIPSAVDGLKPGQRKVLHTALQLRPGQEVKVAQLGPSTAEKTLYAHGEASLNNTIVNMAQDLWAPTTWSCCSPSASLAAGCRGARTRRRRATSTPRPTRWRAASSPRRTTPCCACARRRARRWSRTLSWVSSPRRCSTGAPASPWVTRPPSRPSTRARWSAPCARTSMARRTPPRRCGRGTAASWARWRFRPTARALPRTAWPGGTAGARCASRSCRCTWRWTRCRSC